MMIKTVYLPIPRNSAVLEIELAEIASTYIILILYYYNIDIAKFEISGLD